MSRSWLSCCALAALSPQLLALGEEALAAREAPETGRPAIFSWGDIDGDGRLELAAVAEGGALQLLASTGDGRFEDVSERVGLAGIANVELALWIDYDADGRLDLFVGARAGASRLFHNEGGFFADMSEASGLACAGGVQSADWLDHDGDGRADLHVVTAESHVLFRGLEGGFFERTELPAVDEENVPVQGDVLVDAESSGASSSPGSSTNDSGAASSSTDAVRGARPRDPVGRLPLVAPPTVGESTLVVFPSGCADSIRDQASPGTCLQASSTPTLGRLYPLSANLFVAVGGNVGIGTTSPAATLHVAGTARITDTLTLTPSGNMALDVSTGSIYKGGSLFIHTKGIANIATGRNALYSNTTGLGNSAFGDSTLLSNTTGNRNTAMGHAALIYNSTGTDNTAVGYATLPFNTTGDGNTACGSRALYGNTTGSRNIAVGSGAGQSLTTGDDNIAIGNSGVAAESATIRIGTAGTQTRAFVAGIRGVTTGNADAIPVLVDSTGQLGTVSSSRRFKKDIADMGELTERLLELRPVVFHYRQEQKVPDGGEVPLEYGLIAEEVAEVFPELVVLDDEGQPFTVKYHLLSAMLLNELQEQACALEDQRRELGSLAARLEALEAAPTRPPRR